MAARESDAATRQHSPSNAADYAMGCSDRERQRLMRQGAVLCGFLASAFRAAGIGPGMRVLDLGCGVGDVAIVAADLVGPSGSVVGIIATQTASPGRASASPKPAIKTSVFRPRNSMNLRIPRRSMRWSAVSS